MFGASTQFKGSKGGTARNEPNTNDEGDDSASDTLIFGRAPKVEAAFDSFMKQFGEAQPVADRRKSVFGGQTDASAKRLHFDSISPDLSIPGSAAKRFRPSLSPRSDRSAEVVALRLETARQQQANSKLIREQAELAAKSDKQIRQLKHDVKTLETAKHQCESKHGHLISSLEQQVNNERKETQEATEHINTLDMQLKDKETTIRQLQTQVYELTQQMSSALQQSQTHSNTERRALNDSQTQATEANIMVQSLREKLTKSLQSTHELEMKNNELKIRAEKAETSLREWQLTHETTQALSTELSEMHKLTKHNQSLNNENTKLKRSIENTSLLREQSYTLEQRVIRLTEQNNKLQMANSELTIRLSSAGHLPAAAIDQLINENNQLKEQVQKLKVANAGGDSADKDEMIDALKERLHMKGDFDAATERVMHMEFNPLQAAVEANEQAMHTLQQDNEQMRMRLNEFEKARCTLQTPGTSQGDAVSSLDITQQVAVQMQEKGLHAQIQALTNQIDMLKESQTKARNIQQQLTHNFREMVMMLTGYKIQMKDKEFCTVTSIYDQPASGEQSEHKCLVFKKSADGSVSMIDSVYANEWGDFIETYLQDDDCIPAFMSAITLQLYKRERDEEEEDENEDEENEVEEDEIEDEGEQNLEPDIDDLERLQANDIEQMQMVRQVLQQGENPSSDEESEEEMGGEDDDEEGESGEEGEGDMEGARDGDMHPEDPDSSGSDDIVCLD